MNTNYPGEMEKVSSAGWLYIILGSLLGILGEECGHTLEFCDLLLLVFTEASVCQLEAKVLRDMVSFHRPL